MPASSFFFFLAAIKSFTQFRWARSPSASWMMVRRSASRAAKKTPIDGLPAPPDFLFYLLKVLANEF